MKTSFEQCISEESIIRELCKARVKFAKVRHEKYFLFNILADQKSPEKLKPANWGSIPLNIFPPRRQWHKFRPRANRRGTRPSLGINLDTLVAATLKLRKLNPKLRWAQKLNKVVRNIRKRMNSIEFRFSRPLITPAEKNPAKHEYRPLVQFQLDDKVIDCLTAKYFRNCLDRVFFDSCLAFRCCMGKRSAPTIHDALSKILNMNKRHRQKHLFVAECDIKSFFDCVSHQLVQRALDQAVTEVRKRNSGFSVDPRAMVVFRAYLKAYAFSRDIYAPGTARDRLHAIDPLGQYKWPIKDLRKLYGKKKLQGIGVPQGGALSCLIANLVLNEADRRVEGKKSHRKTDFLYLRYCDDMILLAPRRETCKAAFRSYCRAVRDLLLPVHPPKTVLGYSTTRRKKRFWEGKSNRPYYWAASSEEGIPWIQFVGYQIRQDGLIRVRPKSLRKESDKLTNSRKELLKYLAASGKRSIRKNEHEIKHRFRMKLISMAVGRRRLGFPIEGPLPMCWANGFRGLLGRNFTSHSIKALDRHRERQIKRIEQALESLGLPTKIDKNKAKAHKYYGHPFSYRAQFP